MSLGRESWQIISLGKIASKPQYGYTTKSNRDGRVRYLRTTDLTSGKINWNSVPFCVDEPADISKYKLENNDIVISRAGSVGFHALINNPPEDAVFASYLIRFKPNENIVPKYLSYFFRSQEYWEQITEKSAGVAVQNVNAKKLSELIVPLAPKLEQERIVEKLDSIFEKLEMAQSRLDKVPQLLKHFRMSVLASAVSGDLTEEWRDAHDAPSWSHIKISSIVKKIEAGKNIKCHERAPRKDEFGIVKISAVTWGVYDEEKSKTLTDKTLFLEDRRIKVGDFLFSRANTLELLGMPVIVHQVTKNLMLSDKVWRVVADDDKKQWLSIFLRSPDGRKQIESRATGNQESMRNISQKHFLDIDLPLPSPQEKGVLVATVNELINKADLVEKQYLAVKLRVDKLTQSILARAFRGELFEPFSEKVERMVKQSIPDIADESPDMEEYIATTEQKVSDTPSKTSRLEDDKSELLIQLISASQSMSAQQLFDSTPMNTFKAIDELFVELKCLLELKLIVKDGEGEQCKFKVAKK